MNGWIKFYRKFTEWEWYTDSNTKDLFIHLLLMANVEDKQWKNITIKRGQVLTSIRKLADELRHSERQTRTALNNLRNDTRNNNQNDTQI